MAQGVEVRCLTRVFLEPAPAEIWGAGRYALSMSGRRPNSLRVTATAAATSRTSRENAPAAASRVIFSASTALGAYSQTPASCQNRRSRSASSSSRQTGIDFRSNSDIGNGHSS